MRWPKSKANSRPAGPPWPHWLYRLVPALFFLAWAVAFTYPLLPHLADSVSLSRGGDAWLHLWDLWWVDKALVGLHQSPYQTTFLYYPTGANLYYQSLDLVNALVSIPFQHIFGLTISFNLLLLANLTLDGLAAYWLCRERTGSGMAGLVSGALFASAPLLGTSVSLGQLDEVSVWWVPLYMLALLRALDSPGPVWRRGGGRRAAVCAGLCLVGASLATWYFTAGLVVFTAVFVPCYLLSKRDGARRYWPRLFSAALKVVVAGVLFAIVLGPLLWAMIRERLSGATYMLPSFRTTVFNSADLLALFAPPRLDLPTLNAHNSVVALGYIALALAIVGLAVRRGSAWPLAAGMVAVALMSLGPQLQLAGNNTGLPAPYALLNNVPFIGASRQPLRFLATAGGVLALLAGYGFAWLLGRLRTLQARSVAVGVALFLIVLELFGVPRDLQSTQSGPAFDFLRGQAGPGAVMELPYDNYSPLSLLHQSAHGRPIIGGYTSRHFPYPFADAAPAVAQLLDEDPGPLTSDDILNPPVPDTAAATLQYYGVRYVVVHKPDIDTGRYGHLEAVLDWLFGKATPVYEDANVAIYDSKDASGAGSGGQLPLVGLGAGWHKAEQNPVHRWTGSNVTDGNALVWVGIQPGAVGSYSLSLTAYAYKSPRHVSVVLDGRTVWQTQLGTDAMQSKVDLGHLSEGNHILMLNVQEPPENPPSDERKLAIGVTDLTFTRTGP